MEPAIAVLHEGFSRVLIADAVGLGKTIQAGLIVRQLSAESESFRALVVVPASLREQWASELRTRFDVHTQVVNAAWLAHAARDLPGDVNPWSLPGVYISSFDFIRQPEVLRPLEDTCWDLLVVDEAHAVTVGTARRAAVHGMAVRSRRVVLLTATPHAGDDDQFRALCRIGRSETQPDPIVLFHRSREDVGLAKRRRTTFLAIRLSEPEQRTHRLLERYTGDLSAESRRTGNQQARLLAIVLRKRALSSVSSLAVSCRRRLALLAMQPQADPSQQLPLPLDDDEMQPEDDEPAGILGVPGFSNASRERLCLQDIASAAERAASWESKVARLKRLLTRVKEPVIVFTEYRDTLARLYEHLRVCRPAILLLHGGMTASERSLVQQEFNVKGELLIATDAASEGLNLQHRCRTVIHFELPWSPSRLEQRTGRVDRIGQTRIVHEIILVASDTAERFVLAPLAKKAVRSAGLLSSGAQLIETVTESRVASAILDQGPLEYGSVTLDEGTVPPPTELRRMAIAEAGRVAALRNSVPAAGSFSSLHGTPALFIAPKRVSLQEGVVRFSMLTLTAADGAIVHRELVAIHERRSIGRPRTPLEVRQLLAGAKARWSDTEQRVLRLFSERIDEVRASSARAAVALSNRESVVSAPATSFARQLVQRGLFDRRRETSHDNRARVNAAVVEEESRRVSSLKARLHLTASLKVHAILLIGRPRR